MKAQSSVAVFGHYPPPITGERLCCLHLIKSLRALGFPVNALEKRHGFGRLEGVRIGWLILGSRIGGCLRDFLVSKIQSRGGCTLLVYVHNASWQRIARLGRLACWIFGSRAQFVVLTEEIAATLHRVGLSACVLRNTVTADELSGLRVATAVRRLLWVSAVTEEKGFRVAYEAFVRLRDQDRGWEFDVYGTGLPPTDFPAARFFGVVQGESKRQAFARGGIFILPSRYRHETQPLCLLEAMSIGMPVVATAIGGIPEIIGGGEVAGGACVPVATGAEDLAGAIERVHADYSRYGANALRRFEQYFSHAAFEKSVAAIMEGARKPNTPVPANMTGPVFGNRLTAKS